jgi:hypothetical protein
MGLHTFSRARVALTTLSLVATATAATADAQVSGARARDGKSASIRPGAPVSPDDRIASDRLVFLATHSPTMREMLTVIAVTAGIAVRLRSQPGLQETSWRQGHGVLRVDGASVSAVLEFDSRAPPNRQLETVAHEIAHVVEVVCLPSVTRGERIGSVLGGRGFSLAPRWRGVSVVETLFAVAAGRAVVTEALVRRTGAGTLQVLAHRHGLGRPCADPSTAEMAAALGARR